MLSKILEIQNRKISMEEKNSKRPAPFPKEKGKRTLSKRLRENSMAALKDLLSKQKHLSQMSAASPFPQTKFTEIPLGGKEGLKIDPSAQVMQLYHKLADKLLHIHRQGIQETTLFLDGNAFSSSIFEGAKITITEYSTAPKVFNIEFSADNRALAVFEAHAGELVSAFQNGNFGFEINRIDTSLLAEDEKHSLPKVERDLEKEEESR